MFNLHQTKDHLDVSTNTPAATTKAITITTNTITITTNTAVIVTLLSRALLPPGGWCLHSQQPVLPEMFVKKKPQTSETSASKDRWQCLADRQMAEIVECGHPKSDVYYNDAGMS